MFNYISRQKCLIAMIALMAATLASFPFISALKLLNGIAVVNGLTSGCSDTAINVIILNLWHEACAPYVQALYFFFAIGTGTGPLIAAPFLRSSSNSTTGLDGDAANSLIAPYAISSAVIFVAALLLFLNEVFAKRVDYSDQPQTENNADTLTSGLSVDVLKNLFTFASRTEVLLVVLCAAIMMFYSGTEIVYMEFVPLYSKIATQAGSEATMNEQNISYLYSVMNYVFTAFRGVGVLVTLKFSPQFLAYLDLVIVMVSCVILIIFSKAVTAIWVGNILISIGFASIYPTIYAFIEGRIQVTNLIGGLFVFCSGLTAIFYPVVIGSYIRHYPLVLIWLTLGSMVLTFVLFFVAHRFVKIRKSESNFDSSNIELTNTTTM